MDRSIRAFVRRWLRLPSDTSKLGVFYAPIGTTIVVSMSTITRLFLAIRCYG